jgi:hypothetical protein
VKAAVRILDADGSLLVSHAAGVWKDAAGRVLLEQGCAADAARWESFALGKLQASDVWDGAMVVADDPDALAAELAALARFARNAAVRAYNHRKFGC